MKHLLILLLSFNFAFTIKAQYVTIPDPNLRSYMQQYYPSCFNAANMLDTTCSGVVNATAVYFLQPISNWDGFQFFKNLQEFGCENNQTSIPALPATLKKLMIYWNNTFITSLPDLPNGLTHLSVIGCANLVALPSLPNTMVFLECSGDTALSTTGPLPASLKFLSCSNNPKFTSLPALPASLDTLYCGSDSLSTLPALPVTLKLLHCPNNVLNALPALPPQLEFLDASNEYHLTSLPALPSTLKYLDVSNSLITTLPALSTSLETLNCNGNQLTAMPALPATLKNLNCRNNQISSIPTLPAGMQTLSCGSNNLSVLPTLPATLARLDCDHNQLTVIPTLPPFLNSLGCSYNQLTSLPSLPNSIESVGCNNNPITSLPVLPVNMYNLSCHDCNLYDLPALPESLRMLYIYGNHITCVPYFAGLENMIMDDQIACVANYNYYQIITYDAAQQTSGIYIRDFNPYPVCSAINNVHHCAAFPLITGHVFNDNNNNSIKDANEPYRAHIRIQLSNGTFTFTDNNGYYQFLADSIGNYTATVTLPNYFTSVPLQHNFNFITYDTLVTGDFAFQATAVVDSLSIYIAPGVAARPGFAFAYDIAYSNDGTTTLSPNIVFNYDNTRLTYNSSSNAAVINTGNSLTLSVPGLVSGQQDNFFAFFTVNPAAVIGDSLRAYADITGGTAAASDSDVVAIRGAYDPNDKTATPKLFPSQVINGDYINYTIRFQNTGNDTAFNIVITDTLNGFLQPASLQVINTSHTCKITVKGNVVYFEFINVLLPDSNVNELKSHGYVSFRIKPQSNLVINNIIPNKAAIYFDYNSPVITNTAITMIVDPSTVPLKLLSFTVHKGTGSTANVYWQTSNELNVNGYNVEMSVDGRNYKNVVFETARGDQYDSYTRSVSIPNNDVLYFRLKMTDIDGNYSYSNIAILKNDKSNSTYTFLTNPVKNVLSISLLDESLKNTSATIFNAQGGVVKKIFLQHDVENIDTGSLSAGTYYLVTQKGSRQFVIVK